LSLFANNTSTEKINKYYDNFILDILQNSDADLLDYHVSFGDTNDFEVISKNAVRSNFEYFDKINFNCKFDVGFVSIRNYKVDSLSLLDSDYLVRLKYVLNFICNNSNKHAEYIIYFYGSYNENFSDIICSLNQLFETVSLKSLKFEQYQNFNHTWIICKNFQDTKTKIDFFENKSYQCVDSKIIKNKIFKFRINLVIESLSNFYFLNDNTLPDFKLNNYKDDIIKFVNYYDLPLNILHYSLLDDTTIRYHDMQLLIDFLIKNKIQIINEEGMIFNTFLYIVGLYNQNYSSDIVYILNNKLINENNYLPAFSLPIEIKNNIPIIKNSLVIYNSDKIKQINFVSKYILIKNMKKIDNYDVYMKGNEYNIFKRKHQDHIQNNH
jgi:hypothetical protein